jgi:hypothetical protein
MNLAASFPVYTTVTIKAAGVSRTGKYEVDDDGREWATLFSKAKPSSYSADAYREMIAAKDEKLFSPRAEFYDVVVSYGN